MRLVDQRAQIIRPAVSAVRRIGQAPIMAPVAPPGEPGNRHQLDCGPPGLDQMVELPDRRTKRTPRSECADVKLQEGRLLPRPPFPVICPPWEAVVIDHFAWPEYVLRLKVRGWVRNLKIGRAHV